jgi:hypothetical protein
MRVHMLSGQAHIMSFISRVGRTILNTITGVLKYGLSL